MTNPRRFFAIVALAVMAGVPLFLAPAGAQQLSDREKQIGGKFMYMVSILLLLPNLNTLTSVFCTG